MQTRINGLRVISNVYSVFLHFICPFLNDSSALGSQYTE